MKPETLEKLRGADDEIEWEAPIGFNREAALSRVRQLQPQIEALAGRPFCLDEAVQDASFFTDLSSCKAGRIANQIDSVLALRFSAFGDLFTVCSHCDSEHLPQAVIEQIVKEVESHGFVFVPIAELNQNYTGKHKGFETMSWCIRFFDYI